jgi:hypothetical protein
MCSAFFLLNERRLLLLDLLFPLPRSAGLFLFEVLLADAFLKFQRSGLPSIELVTVFSKSRQSF